MILRNQTVQLVPDALCLTILLAMYTISKRIVFYSQSTRVLYVLSFRTTIEFVSLVYTLLGIE